MTQRPRRRIRIEMPKHGDAPERIDVELVRPDGRVVILHDAFVVKTPSLDRDLYGVRMIDVRFAFDFYQVEEPNPEPLRDEPRRPPPEPNSTKAPRGPRPRRRATCETCGSTFVVGPFGATRCPDCERKRRASRVDEPEVFTGFADFFESMFGGVGVDAEARRKRAVRLRMPPWFELLGRPVTIDEAKAAYKAQCMEKHPDRPGGSEVAMKELNAALRAAHKHFDA
jgi:hypothetical protein